MDGPTESESMPPCSWIPIGEEVDEKKPLEEHLSCSQSNDDDLIPIGEEVDEKKPLEEHLSCSQPNDDDLIPIGEEVDEKKPLEEHLSCSQPNDDDLIPIGEEVDEKKPLEEHLSCSQPIDDDLNENHNVDGRKDISVDIVPMVTDSDRLASDGAFIKDDFPVHLGNNELCFPEEVHGEALGSRGVGTGRTKKLLVLDVNGLLVSISSYVPYDYDPDDIIMKKAVFKRPHCDDFMKFCFDKFNVGVWTSRTKYNVDPILDFLLGSDKSKLLFCWDQSQCTNTGFTTVEKRDKPLLLKKLKKLWNKCDPNLPWETGVYNESNTLLLDDSPYKALSNPRYTAVFPYTYHFKDVNDNSIGPGGDLRVYLEGLADAENVQEYVKQNPFGQRAITEKNLSWGYYRKVIEATSTPPNELHS